MGIRYLPPVTTGVFVLNLPSIQGGDSAAGTQALPVGKIINDKVCRKDNQKGIVNLHMLKDI